MARLKPEFDTRNVKLEPKPYMRIVPQPGHAR
jgi:hypothetical protein